MQNTKLAMNLGTTSHRMPHVIPNVAKLDSRFHHYLKAFTSVNLGEGIAERDELALLSA
jgi:hypothetical protein